MASLVAVDTNLLVRLVTNDDPEQAEKAAADCDAMLSFDARLIAAVRRLGLEPPVQAP